MKQAFSLAGKTALITGGGTGLGFGIARCMSEAGARVVLVARREAPLQEAVQKLGQAATYRVCDVTDVDQLPALVQNVEQSAGPIGILVNNAGVHLKKAAVDTTTAEFEAVIETHVTAAFALTRAVAPGMMERGDGSIIFIASMTSIMGIPLVSAYSAAKSAHLGLVRTLSAEFAPRGVRVNAIAPGWIQSEMLDKALRGDDERKRKILSRTPMDRFGDPDDIGWSAVYLSSPAAKFVTGITLPVDGGASIGF